MGGEEPFLLAVPVRPAPESAQHPVQSSLRTGVAVMWVDSTGELEGAYLPPAAIRELVQSGSQRERTLAICAGVLLRPLHRRPLLLPRLPVSALQP